MYTTPSKKGQISKPPVHDRKHATPEVCRTERMHSDDTMLGHATRARHDLTLRWQNAQEQG
jgi:hypothetical protein